MSLTMLANRVVALGGSRICRPLLARQPHLMTGVAVNSRFLAMGAAPKGKQPAPPPPPPREPEIVEDDEGEYEDFDPLDELNAAGRRRVLAMKELQAKHDELQKDYLKELAQLQAKYQGKYAPLYDERRDIYLGKKDVGKFDVEDDGEEDTGVEEFWLNAMSNHEKVGSYITERDAKVLAYLDDVRSEVLTGEERGFKLHFTFRENPFISNKALEKTYILEAEDDVVPKKFTGCKINWKDPKMDTTKEEQKVRVKAPKGEKGAKAAFKTELVPCDSFFAFFDPPKVPDAATAEKMADDELEEVEDALATDFDMGFALKDQVIPRAVEWFTGEIAPMPEEDYDDEYDEGGDF